MSSPTLPTPRAFVTQLLNSLETVSRHTDDADTESNTLDGVSDATKKQLISLQVLFPNEFVPALDLLDRRFVTRFRICDDEQGDTEAVGVQPHASNHHDMQVQEHDIGDAQVSDDNTSIIEPTHPDETILRAVPHIPPPDKATPDLSQPDQIPPPFDGPTVYYVRSAQARPSRFATSYDTISSYEVRLNGWNCSCPAFAFSAFPATHPEPPAHTYEPNDVHHITPNWVNKMEVEKEWSFGGITLGSDMPPVCKHLLACVLVERCKTLFGGFVEEQRVGWEEAAGWAAGWGD